MAARGSEAAVKNQTSMELEGDRTIVIARTFNGPARIVFDAWTRADLVKRWWAPGTRASIVSVEADVKVGGAYRYLLQPVNGQRFAFSGKYREVARPTRLVYTVFFEPTGEGTVVPESEAAVNTVTFEERDGKTHLVSREVYPSQEVRDMVLASGMEDGMRETMDQLDALVESLG
jgi:uncharacterized protein YndB with AHSA1/START domain